MMFGLPAPHWCYVQYIRTGMPLFLYNFDTRELHGIFKAVGPGDWEVDPLGALRWARRVRGPGGRRRRQEREGRASAPRRFHMEILRNPRSTSSPRLPQLVRSLCTWKLSALLT